MASGNAHMWQRLLSRAPRFTNDNVLYRSLIGLAARNRFLGHLSEMATILSCGFLPNGIPRP
jgi:hypothetical protein